MLKTLITVWNTELRDLLFPEQIVQQLSAVSDVDWVPMNQTYDQAQLKADIHQYDACVTSWGSPKLTTEVLERADKLAFVGHAAGTLVPYVDPAIFQGGIAVVNANTALVKSTAEMALALILSGSWEICRYHDRIKAGLWRDESSTVMGLHGQTVGIIGIGEIARELIRLLRGFHTRILLYSPYCSAEEAEQLGVTLCSMDEMLKESRIVTLHDTLTDQTRGMIGREQLSLLADGSLLINSARGGLIDETALLEQLISGRISAALDVYHQEPLALDSPLRTLPNVTCLPHIGAYSAYWKSQLGAMVVEDLVRFATGKPLLRQVTGERFERMTFT